MTGAGGWAFLGVFVLFAVLLIGYMLMNPSERDQAFKRGANVAPLTPVKTPPELNIPGPKAHVVDPLYDWDHEDEPDFRELEEAMKNFGSTPIIMEFPEQTVTPEFMATMMGDFPNEHGFYELKCLMGCAWLFVSDDYAQAKTMQHEHHVHYHYVGPDEVGDDAYKQFIDGLRWNP